MGDAWAVRCLAIILQLLQRLTKAEDLERLFQWTMRFM